jgi:fatty-acyl-CoA synthase
MVVVATPAPLMPFYASPVGALTSSYWPAEDSTPILETTVGGGVRESAARHGEATALVEGTPGAAADRRRWTFEEMLADAEQVAGALLERFAPGERLAVWAPNTPEWILLELGAGLAGIVLVTVNPTYKPKELEYVLRQSGSSGVFLVPEFRGNPMAAALDEVCGGLPSLRESLLFPEWDAFLASCPPSPRLPEVKPTDGAQIQYTSGTTGFPKGALLQHRGLTNAPTCSSGTCPASGSSSPAVQPSPPTWCGGSSRPSASSSRSSTGPPNARRSSPRSASTTRSRTRPRPSADPSRRPK